MEQVSADTLTSFVAGSTTIDGVPSASSPVTGITIGTLAAGASKVVTFQVKIGNTVPNPNPLPNTATVNYTNGTPVDSNTVNTLVAITNFTDTGIVLTDAIPLGTTFVPGSVTVNGAPSTDLPNTGITIGTLSAGTSSVITFQLQIGTTIPNPNPIPNVATVTSTNAPTVISNTVTTLVFEPSRGVLFI